jgi:peptidoglycan/LPS O-acetylase OafA/YrhL
MTYRPSLDGVRGIAVFLVVFLHIQVFIYQRGPLFGLLDCSLITARTHQVAQ